MQSGNPTLHILRRIFSIHFLMFWWWRAYTCFLSLHGSPSFRNNMKTTAVCCIVFSFIYDSLKHNQSIWKDMKEMIKAVVYVSFICLYIWYWLVIIHCYFSSRETIKHILYQKYKVSFQKYTQLRLNIHWYLNEWLNDFVDSYTTELESMCHTCFLLLKKSFVFQLFIRLIILAFWHLHPL